MNALNQKWIEVKFAFFAYDLYQKLKSYPIVLEYIEMLSDMANINRAKTQNLLVRVIQQNRVLPGNPEFIYLAKKQGITIKVICKSLHISLSTYQEIYSNLPKDMDFVLQYTQTDRKIMNELLEQHEKLKQIGV